MKKHITLLIIFACCTSMLLCGCFSFQDQTNTTDSDQEISTYQERESTAEANPNPSVGKMSDDPFGFEISIDGSVITLPCKASDLEALGYSFGDKAGNMLENNYMTSALMKLDNGNYISVGVYNISGSPQAFADCKIESIYTVDRNSEGQSIQIANGITFGANPDKIKSIYGEEAQDVYEDGEFLYLTYEKGGNDYTNKIQFLFRSNSLYEMDITTRE